MIRRDILSNNTSEYLIEAFVDGSEYTAPIIKRKVLPIIKLRQKENSIIMKLNIWMIIPLFVP